MAAALPAIGMIASAAGTVISVVSGINAANYNAEVANRNAEVAEKNRIETLNASQREAFEYGRDAKQEIGNLEAAIAASGFDMGSGTNLLRRRSLTTRSRQDQMAAREDGRIRSDGFAQQAADFRSEARQQKKSRGMILAGGLANGVTSILGEASALRKAREAYS